MCWNSTVSLNTFLFSLFGALFAYFNNVINKFELLYFISFILIQLVEYFTWINLDNKKTNRLLSQIGLFLIIIQIPLFILSSNEIKNKYKLLMITLYALISIFIISYFTIDYSMNKAPNGHLAWNWLNFPTIISFIWLAFLFIVIFYQKKYLKFIIYFIVVFGIYYTYYKSKTWGSLFCWIANILSLKLILEVFYKDICTM